MKKIEEWQNVDRAVFENEILPATRPAVLRGLLRDWPAVQAGRESASSVVNYFKRFDTGGAVSAMVGPPHINGRFFYTDDFQGFNFGSENVSIGTALDTLLSLADDPQPPAIALQAMHVPDIMPTFQGGSNTSSTLTSAIVGIIAIFSRASCTSTSPMPQPGAVNVISTLTDRWPLPSGVTSHR